MCGQKRFSPTVIATGGPAPPDRNGEISPGTRGAPGRGPDPVQLRLRAGPSTARRSAQDDKGDKGNNHSKEAPGGFTLIELLVVISIAVLLMALLLPALSRARQQARAVVCQSRQRNWLVMFAAYQADYDGRFPDPVQRVWDAQAGEWRYQHLSWPVQMEVYGRTELKDAMLCPTASKPVPLDPSLFVRTADVAGGTTFLAWRLDASWRGDIEVQRVGQYTYFGSYAMNSRLAS